MEWKVTEQGGKVTIDVWKDNDAAGLYKVSIKGGSGRYQLGTMLPEDGRLHLRRTLSMEELKRRGLWPIRRMEEELVYSFRDEPVRIEWKDEILRQCARNLPRHTVNVTGEVISYFFPFDPHKPFPFVPAFCFARVENGRLIFSFRRYGSPYIFQERGNDREEANQQRRENVWQI